MRPVLPAAVEWACEHEFLYVRLSGDVDARIEPDLAVLVRRATGAFRRAIVDLDQVTFFGATGLNFLARLSRCGGTVQLIGLPEDLPIRRQLRAAGLEGVVGLPKAAKRASNSGASIGCP